MPTTLAFPRFSDLPTALNEVIWNEDVNQFLQKVMHTFWMPVLLCYLLHYYAKSIFQKPSFLFQSVSVYFHLNLRIYIRGPFEKSFWHRKNIFSTILWPAQNIWSKKKLVNNDFRSYFKRKEWIKFQSLSQVPLCNLLLWHSSWIHDKRVF